MKDSRCVICKYIGDNNEKKVTQEKIYRNSGKDISVLLCYSHSWELFRLGQKNFLETYKENFMQFFGTETEKELINYVKGNDKQFGNWSF
jgi:hypothetical protein